MRPQPAAQPFFHGGGGADPFVTRRKPPTQREPQPPDGQPKPKMTKTAQTVLAGCSTGVIILLILAVALALLPHLLGMQMLAVVSGSMKPAIPVYSMVLVKAAPYEQIKVRDVITFKTANTMVTHRVVEKRDGEKKLVTKGDANNATDAPISYENVVGVVRFHMRFLGYPLSWLQSTSHKIIAVTVVIAVWLIVFILVSGFGAEPQATGETRSNTKRKSARRRTPHDQASQKAHYHRNPVRRPGGYYHRWRHHGLPVGQDPCRDQ
jgi:signal peptidase I